MYLSRPDRSGRRPWLAIRIAHPRSISWWLGCLWYLIVGLPPGWAQDQVIFADEFDDNRHQWPVVDTRTQQTWLEDGHYVIQVRSNALNFAYLQAVTLDPGADYDLEVALLQESGDKNMGLGLVWGAQVDERDLFTFLLSTNGQYTILRKLRHAYSHIKRWTPSPLVAKPKAWNVIRVSRRGEQLHFFLNDQKVYVFATEPWRSPYIGILLHGTMRVRVDYLRLTLPAGGGPALPVFPLDTLLSLPDSGAVLPYIPSELVPVTPSGGGGE